MGIKFVKAEGAGNDFIIVDLDDISKDTDLSQLAQMLCERKKSIGADGLLIYDKSDICDFKMRVFNPDGQEVAMCGNGARCICLYANKRDRLNNKLSIETKAGCIEAQIKNGVPRIKMPIPKDIRLNFDLKLQDTTLKANFINTGVPHVVYFVNDLDNFDVRHIGKELRYHKEFQPKGTNANFVKVIDNKSMKLRTYERGVEDETLACGTGAVASALVASKLKNMKSPIDIYVKSGDILRVSFDKENTMFKDIYLEGECKLVYEGDLLREGRDEYV